jgi:hypothetical protein
VSQTATSDTARKTGTSASASADQPSDTMGTTSTNMPITSSAPVRLPASEAAVPRWCSACSPEGAAASTAAMTAERTR